MLRLHNTLTRRKEWFRPEVEGKVAYSLTRDGDATREVALDTRLL